jgi:ADP-heptose:LPS heptosyltransferase
LHARGPLDRILIVQTAFIGDVILATSLVESIKRIAPQAKIDFFLRAGNEGLLRDNPHINKVYIWDKKKAKTWGLIKHIVHIRRENYNLVLNIQRFFNSGLLTALSGAEFRVGFDKNPLSFFFDGKIDHHIPHYGKEGALHEVQRNLRLFNWYLKVKEIPKASDIPPKLYFNQEEEDKISYLVSDKKDYIVMAPASVWFTKALPLEKWKKMVQRLHVDFHIFIVGAPSDKALADSIIAEVENVTNLCGELTLKESAKLMERAAQVFVNDSGPLHLASSVNAKTTAFFCSTLTDYGYFPISKQSRVVEIQEKLPCRPCGLHGKVECPNQHFDCGHKIDLDQALDFHT